MWPWLWSERLCSSRMYTLKLNHQYDASGGSAFGRHLGHEEACLCEWSGDLAAPSLPLHQKQKEPPMNQKDSVV